VDAFWTGCTFISHVPSQWVKRNHNIFLCNINGCNANIRAIHCFTLNMIDIKSIYYPVDCLHWDCFCHSIQMKNICADCVLIRWLTNSQANAADVPARSEVIWLFNNLFTLWSRTCAVPYMGEYKTWATAQWTDPFQFDFNVLIIGTTWQCYSFNKQIISGSVNVCQWTGL
jgi:hypothetical protein